MKSPQSRKVDAIIAAVLSQCPTPTEVDQAPKIVSEVMNLSVNCIKVLKRHLIKNNNNNKNENINRRQI